MPVTAKVYGAMQISGYDEYGGNSPLVVPVKVRGGSGGLNLYRNTTYLLGVGVPADLHPILVEDTLTLADSPDVFEVKAKLDAYLATKLGTAPRSYRGDLVSDAHKGTATGWEPAANAFLFELEYSDDAGASWATYESYPKTYNGAFGGASIAQPVLSVWW